MDFASVGGILLALIGILGGLILEGGSIAQVTQPTAMLIVLGGTVGDHAAVPARCISYGSASVHERFSLAENQQRGGRGATGRVCGESPQRRHPLS